MKTFALPTAIVSLSILASCAADKSHTAQVALTGAKALVEFENRTDTENWFQIFDEADRCTKPAGGARVIVHDKQSIYMPAAHPISLGATVLSIRLPAVTTCQVIVTFTPEDGATYRAELYMEGPQCQLFVKRKSTNSAGATEFSRIPVVQRTPKAPIFASQGYCEP